MMSKKKILYRVILQPFFTLLLGYYAYKYLWVSADGYSIYSVLFGLFSLIFFIIIIMKIFTKQDSYAYVRPMLKAAKVLLLKDYSSFKKSIMPAVKSKEFYFVDDKGEKYHTEYFEKDDHEELNKRYLKMALLKDIKITKQDGNDVQECVQINSVGNSLERYLFVYAKENNFITPIHSDDDFVTKINFLISPYKIEFDSSHISTLDNESNESYSITHEGLCYSSEVWSKQKIDSYLKTAMLLEKKGYTLFIAYYNSDNRYFGLVPNKSFFSLTELKEIKVLSIKELLTKHVGERHYTYMEKFNIFYKEIESEISENEYETIYRISSSTDPLKSLSYIAGTGVGVDEENYPMFNNIAMQHACTFDMNDFPKLAKQYSNVRAISLYISDFMENEAYEVETNETRVLLLTQEDIDTKKLKKSMPMGMKSLSMKVKAYKIPKGLLSKSILDYEEGSWKRELYNYLYNFNYVGGSPIWIQSGYGVDASSNFIAQFDDSLFSGESSINFGGGIMYLFDDLAFWEC